MYPHFDRHHSNLAPLMCPACGGCYLHHEPILLAQVPDLVIPFWCENCEVKPILTMLHYKGQTVFAWTRRETTTGVLLDPDEAFPG